MKKLKLKHKVLLIIVIVVVVTMLSIFFNQSWVLVFYSTILSLFPEEIKNFFIQFSSNKSNIRVSYSYIFRIEINGWYLLVKDEQGRNNYHPVGGVYKYYPEQIGIAEKFDGTYDGLFNDTQDTQNDLRLIIKKNRLKQFKIWFSKETERENISNLSREFKEELIERKILPDDIFNNIKYKYLGSYTKKSYNETLKMDQIRHYDIIDLRLTNSQKSLLRNINKSPTSLYLFATKNNIESGFIESGGNRYDIADYSKLIIIGNNDYNQEFDNTKEYSIKTI